MKLRTIDGICVVPGEVSGLSVVITKSEIIKSLEEVEQKISELDKFNNAIIEIKNNIKDDETKKDILEVITNKLFLNNIIKNIESTHNTAQQAVEFVSNDIRSWFNVIDAKNMNKISSAVKKAAKIINDKIVFHHDSIISESTIVVVESIDDKGSFNLVKSWRPSGLVIKNDITFQPAMEYIQKNNIPTIKLGDKFYFVNDAKQLAIKDQIIAL